MKPREAILPAIRLFLRDRKSFFKQLLNYTREGDRRIRFASQYHHSTLPFVDLCELLGSLDETIDNYTFLDGTSRVSDLIFLKALCRTYPQCQYLEIGSWRGESLYNVAQVASKCISLSLSKEEIIAMGLSKEFAENQRLFTAGLKNVIHLEANSLKYDFSQIKDRFDVIFIDGDHSYEGVKSDTQNAFTLLRNENSVIVWHDCGNGFEDYRFEVLAGIFDGCPPEFHRSIYRVSNTLCGIYTRAQVKPQHRSFPQKPTKTFSLRVTSKAYPNNLSGNA
jgi:hypothetical protein